MMGKGQGMAGKEEVTLRMDTPAGFRCEYCHSFLVAVEAAED